MPQEIKPPQAPDLDAITAGTANVPAVLPDPKTQDELGDLSEAAIAARLQRYSQDTTERKKYAGRVYCLVVGWIAGVGVLLFCQGFGFFSHPFESVVLTALVGTSTVSVAGILWSVVKNLFHSGER